MVGFRDSTREIPVHHARAGATGIDVGVWIRLGGADDVYEIAAVDTTASELTLATKFFYGTAAALIVDATSALRFRASCCASTRRRWSTSRASSA